LDADLKELKENIEKYAREINQEVWFYPEYEGVKGFSGTQDIILLGLNPSSGTFPSPKDKLLYDLLKKKGLEFIHITDFIKVRAKNKHVTDLIVNDDLMKKQANFFSDEMYIIKPKIIITMGYQCDNLLKQYFPKIENICKVFIIKHYGYRFKSTKEVFEEISQQLDKIKEEYSKR
jgi:hypothetical protein